MCGSDTWGHGLVGGLAVLAYWLASAILELSSLKDSVIPSFWCERCRVPVHVLPMLLSMTCSNTMICETMTPVLGATATCYQQVDLSGSPTSVPMWLKKMFL